MYLHVIKLKLYHPLRWLLILKHQIQLHYTQLENLGYSESLKCWLFKIDTSKSYVLPIGEVVKEMSY